MKLSIPPVVPAILAALGALSLGWAVYTKHKRDQERKDGDSSFDENKKKRPPSEKSSPEHSKRARTTGLSPDNGTKGAQGSVTDISSLMAAKTAIPSSDQTDPEKLGKHYAKMAFKFENEGLNVKAVDDARKYYKISGKEVEPLVYTEFQTPLSRGAVRLGVFRILESDAEALADMLYEATQDIVKEIPEGSVVHCNRKDHYHMTVQMISHPSNPRPDSGVPGGGFDPSKAHSVIPSPSPSVLVKETSTYKEIASSSTPPELKVHSIIFANSGTLLLLFTDSTGQVFKLRSALAQAFPGAVESQPSIMHVTLARLLTAEQISRDTRERIVRACENWTEKLKGKALKPGALWHVQENTFTYIDDKSSLELPFQG